MSSLLVDTYVNKV